MTAKSAQNVLVAALIVGGVTATAANWARGRAVPPRTYVGLGAAYAIATLLAQSIPGLGASMSILIATGVVLEDGSDAFAAIQRATKTGISFPSGGSDAPTYPFANLGGVFPALESVFPGAGSSPFNPPTAAKDYGKVIGRPYQGTHTRGDWQSDNADDYSLPVGTPILAAVAGNVNKIAIGSSDATHGYQVTISANAGPDAFYGHLSSVTVQRGQKMKKGQQIGTSGTGNGVPHLHFAVIPPYRPEMFGPDSFPKKGA